MIFAVYSVWNEADNLPRAMDSVEAVFPEVTHVTVDGKYPDFPGYLGLSRDGTREVARQRGYLLTCIDYECEKRSMGLKFVDDLATRGDFVLVLDADEEITQVFGIPDRVGSIAFTRESSGTPYGRCRLFAWEPGLEFKHRHYDLYDAAGELVSSLEDAPDFQVVGTGIHHDKAHDAHRQKAKQTYYRVLRAREGHPSRAAM